VVGAVLLATGYVGTGLATTTGEALVAYAAGGAGAGAVYTVAVNTPVKWFTERRGLATGVVTMAYGGTSVLFIPFVRDGLATDFAGTLAALGAVTGVAALVAAAVVRDPGRGDGGERTAATDERAYGWRETVRTWQFWVLYALFVVVNGVGLMLVGKAVAFAREFGFAAAVATGAASVVALSDSAGIVTVGGLSDRVGRERTVAATVTCSGLALGAAVWAGEAGRATLFVVLLGAAAFFRSPVFSVVPALVATYYGRARSSENYALLYTAKVWGGVGGGVAASLLITAVGWSTAFLLGAAALTGAGLLTGLLRPVE
jgi:OFA family oxalate/formate antiporter-like MFS transporter